MASFLDLGESTNAFNLGVFILKDPLQLKQKAVTGKSIRDFSVWRFVIQVKLVP